MEKDLNIYLTGAGADGGAQTDPNASLGGNRSSARVASLSHTALANITGVTVDDLSVTSGEGSAQLSFTAATSTLAYTAPGDTQGQGVDVSVDGTYELYSGTNDRFAIVTVTAESLPGADATDSITLTWVTGNLFDSVGSGEAQAGITEYRAVMLKNDGGYTMNAAQVWIESNTPFADDSVEIGLETPDGANALQTVADETTAPTGVTFSTAAGEANALSIGNLAAGAMHGVWIKRVVNPTTQRYPANSFTLTFKADTV